MQSSRYLIKSFLFVCIVFNLRNIRCNLKHFYYSSKEILHSNQWYWYMKRTAFLIRVSISCFQTAAEHHTVAAENNLRNEEMNTDWKGFGYMTLSIKKKKKKSPLGPHWKVFTQNSLELWTCLFRESLFFFFFYELTYLVL